ncbi:4'-phosphopantetheinyl transferase family protein [Neptunomonas antarctica]|uniref:Phosphopantetheinyl transferase n=1 Tax=Neptunomonas antarctica TaxID=619304 RepID=A0A1N7ITM1_9GAMM|nr:4'-phosphopantetheinyl transferase superfamily protein [Neptunomonas antarctica]SIS40321.1 Phosphopantetheinyl transferase [Neptunomonas antarctica]
MLNDLYSGHGVLLLWFARVEALTKSDSEYAENLLSPSEMLRLRSINSPKKRREYLQSRLLMRRALSDVFDETDVAWIFIEHPSRAPEIENIPSHMHYSLTHSNGLICFALSNGVVGVDVELTRFRTNFTELAAAFMSEEELKLLADLNKKQAMFYRIWCAKEAYFKALTEKEQIVFSFTEQSLPRLQAVNPPQWVFNEGRIDGFVISVVTDKHPAFIRCYPASMDPGLSVLPLN